MNDTIQAVLASWSIMRTADNKPWTDKVTKSAVKNTLATAPRKIEFFAIATPFQKSGYFFIDEVAGKTIELRYNGDRDLMFITVDTDGTPKSVR